MLLISNDVAVRVVNVPCAAEASAAQGTFTTLTATSLEISNILTVSGFQFTATSGTIANTLTVQNLVITGDQSTTNTNIDGGHHRYLYW